MKAAYPVGSCDSSAETLDAQRARKPLVHSPVHGPGPGPFPGAQRMQLPLDLDGFAGMVQAVHRICLDNRLLLAVDMVVDIFPSILWCGWG